MIDHGKYQRGLVETDKCLTNTNKGLTVDQCDEWDKCKKLSSACVAKRLLLLKLLSSYIRINVFQIIQFFRNRTFTHSTYYVGSKTHVCVCVSTLHTLNLYLFGSGHTTRQQAKICSGSCALSSRPSTTTATSITQFLKFSCIS